MATMFFLPSTGAAPVTPATWIFPEQINPLTLRMERVRQLTAQFTKSEPTGTTSPVLRAMFRYVSTQLQAQTISGTIRGIIRASESNADANATLAIAAKIVQPDGSDRAVLLGVTASDNAGSPQELSTGTAGRRFWEVDETQPIDLTPGDAVAGDYLVVEIGFRSATTTSRNIGMIYGDPFSSPMQYIDGAGSGNPWVEFSQDIAMIQSTGILSVALDGITVSGSGAVTGGAAAQVSGGFAGGGRAEYTVEVLPDVAAEFLREQAEIAYDNDIAIISTV